mmetsp:Transcript_36647/g.116641  ORF Transcript_36647/g.116641 Transcript_36647/m.116641 type:complete len:363 (-) Transcript_36647:916-2004(-)
MAHPALRRDRVLVLVGAVPRQRRRRDLHEPWPLVGHQRLLQRVRGLGRRGRRPLPAAEAEPTAEGRLPHLVQPAEEAHGAHGRPAAAGLRPLHLPARRRPHAPAAGAERRTDVEPPQRHEGKLQALARGRALEPPGARGRAAAAVPGLRGELPRAGGPRATAAALQRDVGAGLQEPRGPPGPHGAAAAAGPGLQRLRPAAAQHPRWPGAAEAAGRGGLRPGLPAAGGLGQGPQLRAHRPLPGPGLDGGHGRVGRGPGQLIARAPEPGREGQGAAGPGQRAPGPGPAAEPLDPEAAAAPPGLGRRGARAALRAPAGLRQRRPPGAADGARLHLARCPGEDAEVQGDPGHALVRRRRLDPRGPL